MGEYTTLEEWRSKFGKVTKYKKKWVLINIANIMTSFSGEILNQLWRDRLLKYEADITRTPHLAFYKDEKQLSKSHEERKYTAFALPDCMTLPIKNIIKNLYISDVNLQNTLVALRDIDSKI